jgi:hypothetical protein
LPTSATLRTNESIDTLAGTATTVEMTTAAATTYTAAAAAAEVAAAAVVAAVAIEVVGTGCVANRDRRTMSGDNG